jgi:hypothetical protein
MDAAVGRRGNSVRAAAGDALPAVRAAAPGRGPQGVRAGGLREARELRRPRHAPPHGVRAAQGRPPRLPHRGALRV